MPEELKSPGLIEDPRKTEEKAKDFRHEELSAGVLLNWNRGVQNAPVYSVRDQNGSGSCVAQSTAKALEVSEKKIISAHPIYSRRFNKPGFGMYLQDAGDIMKKHGTTTEELDPSQRMTEAQMNTDVTVETPIKRSMYAFPNVKEINQIAEAIELYGHCKITLGFTIDEYAYSVKPIYNGKPATDYHDICGIYYFTDENGEKCILADESWGQNNIRQRILTESYLKARGTGAMYFFPNDDKPHHTFKMNLSYGMMNNVEVKYLQDILKYEGLFPKSQLSTGNYLQITARAVLAFQNKYGISPPSAKNVGPKTRAKLNELYS